MTRSKGNLAMMIMGAYAENVTDGWRSILTSPSTPIEKLDALLWFDTNVVYHFSEERRIQSAALQLAPPSSPDLTATFPTQLRLLKEFVTEGLGAEALQIDGAPTELATRCLFRVIWPSQNVVDAVGIERTFEFERDILVRGAASRT
jgi:hypothetical protein